MRVEQDQGIEVGGLPIAFDRIVGEGPGVVFFGGYASHRGGTKATALWEECLALGRSCLRFDYSGHGGSGGDFAEGTIGRWLDEALAVVDQLTEGPQCFVGSSMGGWIALLAARARPDRTAALLTVAAAPDFTRSLPERLPPEAKEALSREGRWLFPATSDTPATVLTLRFIEESREHLLLDAPIAVGCPVHLLHGLADADVPWELSLRAAKRLTSPDVTLELIPGGDHRLSTPADIERMLVRLSGLLRLLPR